MRSLRTLAFSAPAASAPAAGPTLRREAALRRRASIVAGFVSAPRGVGVALSAALFAAVVAAAFRSGDSYSRFVAAYGAPRDIAARALGFGVDAITISGPVQLKVADVLKAADVAPTASLPFLDVEAVRARVAAIPKVRDATVRKLYPDRLLVTLVERAPAGVWQDGGKLEVVSADGTPFEPFSDMRLADLPYVVGPGAAAHLAEYAAIRDAAGELKPRIRAGVYVGDRRWNLAMTDGTSVLLPEDSPQTALKRLIALQRGSQLLDKDVVAVDLREADRVFVRLSPAAAAERVKSPGGKSPGAKSHAAKPKIPGGAKN